MTLKRTKFRNNFMTFTIFVKIAIDFVDCSVKTPKTWVHLWFRWAFVTRYVQFVKENASHWPELSNTLKLLSFLMQFLYISERFCSNFQHNHLNSKRTILTIWQLKHEDVSDSNVVWDCSFFLFGLYIYIADITLFTIRFPVCKFKKGTTSNIAW